MKQFLFVSTVGLILALVVSGQDAASSQDSRQPQAAVNSSGNVPESVAAGGTDPTASGAAAPTSGSKIYNSESYSGRTEVFVTGFAFFTSRANGNAIAHQATESGGASAGYRFHLNSWSALEGRYGFSHNSQKYDIGGAVSSIPAYLSEITGSYVYTFPKMRRIQPFLEGGGGIVHFSPGNYGSGSNSSSGSPTGSSGGGGLGPYVVSQPLLVTPLAAPIYSGSTPGVASQSRPTFMYGAGVDFPAFSRFSFRVEYRGLGYKTPDFNQAGLQTNVFNFISVCLNHPGGNFRI